MTPVLLSAATDKYITHAFSYLNLNRKLAGLDADLTSTDVNKGYKTHSKSKINSTVQDTEEDNVLPLQKPPHSNNKDALASAAATLSLLSPPTDNCNSQHLNQRHMKCYYNHTHHHFLDYFNKPISGDTEIYAGDIPLW